MGDAVSPPPSARLPVLPVVPRAYHDFYRTPRFRWWHSLVALVAFVLGWGTGVLAATVVAVLYEILVGGATVEQMGQGRLTPALFLANNVGIALAIPVAVAVHRFVFGQRPGWLFSIQGRLRRGVLGRFLLVAAVVHLAVLVAWLGIQGPPGDLRIRSETWFLLAAIVLTTPFQAAGEEVAFRGLGARLVGSWFAASRIGLIVSTTVTAGLFVLLHRAEDLWLNLLYICLALAASALTWWTGGVEAAVALHVVANLTTMLFVPFLGLEGFFERGSGSGGEEAMAQALAVLLAAAALLWQAGRIGLARSLAPEPQGQEGRPAGR